MSSASIVASQLATLSPKTVFVIEPTKAVVPALFEITPEILSGAFESTVKPQSKFQKPL